MKSLLALTNEPCGTELQEVINTTAREVASLQQGCNVHFLFRASHWTDNETGKHGIRWLIARILAEANAYSPNTGLTSAEVISKVRAANGTERYPDSTVHQYLSVVMVKSKQVGKIRMNGVQDYTRNCKVPRCKFYLLASE